MYPAGAGPVDDPAGPTTTYSISEQQLPASFPDPFSPLLPERSALPSTAVNIAPRRVTLRDRQTVATILPVVSAQSQLPASLIAYLCGQMNREIEGGDTYPMTEPFTCSAAFVDYWFRSFGAVMLLGDFAGGCNDDNNGNIINNSQSSADDNNNNNSSSNNWARDCLGSFHIRPKYPGRSSHVCTGGLLVTDAARNRGVARLMGEALLDWAPRLGYTYSVFDLVYETNVASCRIWDALGFKRIGRVKGCGQLRSHPDRLVDAIIYGRDLPPPPPPPPPPLLDGDGSSGGDNNNNNISNSDLFSSSSFSAATVEEQRFDRIRFYLKFDRYPDGADRAEKSRLRSAATHYKLVPDDENGGGDGGGGGGEILMLKDRLVVSDPARQYAIARATHGRHHGGINKTTALIAEKYHWSRIKETVSDVIRLCAQCKELAKAPPSGGSGSGGAAGLTPTRQGRAAKLSSLGAVAGVKRSRSWSPTSGGRSGGDDGDGSGGGGSGGCASPSDISVVRPLQTFVDDVTTTTRNLLLLQDHVESAQFLQHDDDDDHNHHHHPDILADDDAGDGGGGSAPIALMHPEDMVFQPIDPRIMNDDDDEEEETASNAFDAYHAHPDFQTLLRATAATEEQDQEQEQGDGDGDITATVTVAAAHREQVEDEESECAAAAVVDRDLEMLMEHGIVHVHDQVVQQVDVQQDGTHGIDIDVDVDVDVDVDLDIDVDLDLVSAADAASPSKAIKMGIGTTQAGAEMDDLDEVVSVLGDPPSWT